ncbi:MAG: putative peptidoglycan glycosyltransferase FtsW [Candidatus Paceibacterota bacterium]
MKTKSIDKVFLGIVISLTVIGVFMFISASFGILAKNEAKFYSVLLNQLTFGLVGGIIMSYVLYRIDYRLLRKYALYIFLASLMATLLVFVPNLGFRHGGALRWLDAGAFSIQPVEFLKIGFVIYFAAWLSLLKNKASDIRYSIIFLLGFLGIIAVILLKQPDTKSLILITVTALSMLFAYGIPWKYILGLFGVICAGFLILAMFVPYLNDRLYTFIHPSYDISGSSYQLQQSLIAIGSGGMFGRGFGQSIQKFSYLPEPQGDSIFAVIGEEFGFIGGVALILLFVAFAMRGLRIASRAPDLFSRLLVTGIVILFVAQSFLNIASIIGVFPLTGVPLIFISQGGTSLLFSLAAIGIVLQISKQQS